MTNIPELIRSRATQIGEIRRTGSTTLAAALLKDLFLIAEGVETGASAQAIADMLSDSLSVTAPAPAPDVSALPYLAIFRGQGEQFGHIVDLDDRHEFAVSEQEAQAAVPPGTELIDAIEFDELKTAATAPADVRNWSGPFEIKLERRRYRIESDHAGSVPLYADTIADVRTILLDLFASDASDHDQDVARPLALQIAGLDESHLDAPGSCARFEGVGISQAVRAQVQDLEWLPDAEAA